MNSNFRLGSLFGIPFYLNASWFLVLLFFSWTYGNGLAAQFPELIGIGPWLLGFGTAILLFSSVLAHELGHSLVAMQQGIEVKSITLFLFGGLASLEEESKTPAGAFAIAIAGPAVSVLLWALLSYAGLQLPISGPIAAIVGFLATINLFLALFNMIPGLPLDGGNVLKAAVWKITGNRYRGIRIAARAGQVVGGVAIASGILSLSVWNALIGWFLYQNAGQAFQSSKLQEELSRYTAADVVTEGEFVIGQDDSLRQLANQAIPYQGKVSKFLVVDEQGQLVGSVNLEDLNTVPTMQWPQVSVQEILQPTVLPPVVQSNQSLLDIVALLDKEKLQTIAVVNDSGALMGLLEKVAIRRLQQGMAAASA
ncbi:site-2 protease family protein [Acaryochloris sp. 'Moss Beach']|uniref:site-2 protease family protein n=1 Tax=Acaryochloris sp. 'Moss Beach' TaxID=2740837 RepID=UPI001F17C8FD|nr:site-2 protease family protein [Acaryochloris sp. 'Moss Beach']UJB69045.1 site-2 protease family protein [Acaryochloris sp. 'Moss Beach']